MKAFGAPQSEIDRVLRAEGILPGDEEPEEIEIFYLAEFENSIRVFRTIKPELYLGSMGGVVYGGVSAQEVRAACLNLLIAKSEYPDITDNVQAMAAVAANLKNEAQNEQAERERERRPSNPPAKR